MGALIAPVLPGLSDSRAQLAETVGAVMDAGGTVNAVVPLYLRGATRDHFLTWLRAHDPALHARYLRHYDTGSHVSKDYSAWVTAAVAEAIAARGGTYPGAQRV